MRFTQQGINKTTKYPVFCQCVGQRPHSTVAQFCMGGTSTGHPFGWPARQQRLTHLRLQATISGRGQSRSASSATTAASRSSPPESRRRCSSHSPPRTSPPASGTSLRRRPSSSSPCRSSSMHGATWSRADYRRRWLRCRTPTSSSHGKPTASTTAAPSVRSPPPPLPTPCTASPWPQPQASRLPAADPTLLRGRQRVGYYSAPLVITSNVAMLAFNARPNTAPRRSCRCAILLGG